VIDLNDPSAVCRSIGYFIDFLRSVGPALALVVVAWRVSK